MHAGLGLQMVETGIDPLKLNGSMPISSSWESCPVSHFWLHDFDSVLAISKESVPEVMTFFFFFNFTKMNHSIFMIVIQLSEHT